MNQLSASPSLSTAAGVFTAARIAAALGRPARSVRRVLEGIPADGSTIVNGNATASWSIPALPEAIQFNLRSEAKRRGYISEEHLLNEPPAWWEPPVPLSRCNPHAVDSATKLQRALHRTLIRLQDARTPKAEITVMAQEEYRAVFGRSISSRQLERLLSRTIGRDAGAERWDRIELFLPESVAAKKAEIIPIGFDAELQPMFDACARCVDRANPTHNELCLFWDAAFTCADALIYRGESIKRSLKTLRTVIAQKVPFITSRGNALEKLVRRKFERWVAGGKSAAAVADHRAENSGPSKRAELPKEFREKLLARAHVNCGRVAQSWREAISEGWMPAEVAAAYPFNWESKSYVPATIRKALETDLEILKPMRIGPKHTRLTGPYISRDYTQTPSGKIFSSDDCTLPVWFWVPDDAGNPVLNADGRPILTRGQWLPWICARSQYIITAQLIPEKGYDSVDILRGIARVHDEYGLPDQFYFECGIWKSLLIDGSIRERGSWSDYVYGLSSRGIKIRHAQPGNPRSKIVENVLGQIQNRTNRLRGYAGRRPEDCPEETKRQRALVLSGKAHPGEYFYSQAEWVGELNRICDVFNEEPQNGQMLDGLSPRQAFEQFRESPPIKLPEQLRYLLARSCVETTVKANGVRVGKFFYKGAAAGALQGERVLAWFNPEDLDSICITDLKQKNPVTLNRDVPIAAFDATPEEFEQANRMNHAQTKYRRTLHSSLQKNFSEEFLRQKRAVFAPPSTAVVLGNEMETQRKQATENVRADESLRSRGRKLAREVGVEVGGRSLDQTQVDALNSLKRLGLKVANPYQEGTA